MSGTGSSSRTKIPFLFTKNIDTDKWKTPQTIFIATESLFSSRKHSRTKDNKVTA